MKRPFTRRYFLRAVAAASSAAIGPYVLSAAAPNTIPRSPGHHKEWIMACKEEKPFNYPGSNFTDYAGPLTENMLLAAMAIKIGQEGFKIECNPVAHTVKTQEAHDLVERQYGAGWKL